ncbi:MULTISPECIES: non-hydrolyzing UDP-N-acetylglucosamine 2-epimerase [Nosocomiicoccus]|uniref:UDP-N-acetylglucosamine 2-epimerase (non-hydrolyzing) n=1 Tax=Nosocomiicoccus massiliensis TaxID=1232430 RepID=A0AAF1BUR5_9STAP|nr:MULTISPECIES: UDP-N-acetylglucosamine 2-epimerase (non-hydrolyzing) [Nosocomiicoccus]OFL48951.1 UDP-N-acetyl glucosamine 2-epimerase [Nosocomiicoccus sp. HMSC067E10]WOS95406.1 UDP-N-acetylglucosamine 2-epimerase (non-hydrolyzing) [Nosocomiicoccus massiliensis]
MKKRIMVVFGTRPEAIKMAPLVNALKESKHLEPVVVVTAQHREMLDQVLNAFNITPDYDLNVMRAEQTLSHITSQVLKEMESIIQKETPNMVLVHGDTTTTFSAALAAFYQKVSIGHVEAGLRTYNKFAPYPEELNRQLTTRLADLHFAPTLRAKDNLLKEQVDESTIFVTGNTVIDALNTTVDPNYNSKLLSQYKDKRVILLTAHRRENLGEPMIQIFKAMKHIADTHRDVVIVYPVHKNPKIRELAQRYLTHDRIELIEPLDVMDFHNFAAASEIILTDSGGIQEEAPSLNKPVLVLRDVTERPEGVESGVLKIVGTDFEKIVTETNRLLNNREIYDEMTQLKNPYGDGQASHRIVDIISHYYGFILEKPSDFMNS